MMVARGNRRDYDIWEEEHGAKGWSYEDVLPYFKSIENVHAEISEDTREKVLLSCTLQGVRIGTASAQN